MKAFTKRFTCLTLALVLMVCLVPDITPKAQATGVGVSEIQTATQQITKVDVSVMLDVLERYRKTAQLEKMVTTGALTGMALTNAKVVLAQLRTGLAASGFTAATLSKFFYHLAVIGVVIDFIDWEMYWWNIFDHDKFLENYKDFGNPVSNFLGNTFTADEKVAGFLKLIDPNYENWNGDVAELSKGGWDIIRDWAKKTFGITDNTPSGKTETPPIGMYQALDLTGCKLWATQKGQITSGEYEIHFYTVPDGWTFVHPNTGYSIGQSVKNGRIMPYGTFLVNGVYKTGWLDEFSSNANATYYKTKDFNLMVEVYVKDKGMIVNQICIRPWAGITPSGGGSQIDYDKTKPYDDMPFRVLDVAPQPITNNTPISTQQTEVLIEDLAPEEREKAVITYPPPNFEYDPEQSEEQNVDRFISDAIPKTPPVPKLANEPTPEPTPTPTPEPTPEPSPEPTPQPSPEPTPEPDPEDEQTKKKLDFSPLMNIGGLDKIFPFCLPFDFINLIKNFNAPRKEPIFNLKFPFLKGRVFNIVLNMTPIAPIMPLVRSLLLMGFVIALITNTAKFIKW